MVTHHSRFISCCIISRISHRSEDQSQLCDAWPSAATVPGPQFDPPDCHTCVSATWMAPCARRESLLYLAFSRHHLYQQHKWSTVAEEHGHKSLRLSCTRFNADCDCELLLTGRQGLLLKPPGSMFTLFFTPLTCSFIVRCPGTPSPVSDLPLDRSCILQCSRLFIILSAVTAG